MLLIFSKHIYFLQCLRLPTTLLRQKFAVSNFRSIKFRLVWQDQITSDQASMTLWFRSTMRTQTWPSRETDLTVPEEAERKSVEEDTRSDAYACIFYFYRQDHTNPFQFFPENSIRPVKYPKIFWWCS